MADPKPHPDYSIHKFSLLGNPRLGPDEDRISISPDHMAAYNAKFHPLKPPSGSLPLESSLISILKSEHHESAFWNAFHPAGGCPFAPGHKCHEDHIWLAYCDLEFAGLIRRSPDEDKFRGGKLVRCKFRPTDAATAAFEKLKAYREANPAYLPAYLEDAADV